MNATNEKNRHPEPHGEETQEHLREESAPGTDTADGPGSLRNLRGTPQDQRGALRVRGSRRITHCGDGLSAPRSGSRRSRPRRLRHPGGQAAAPGDPPVTDARRALGRYGEELAARHLTAVGMRILARNWRCQDGEIDIVAADHDALVLCEVKTRRAGSYEHPMAAVRPEKAARLLRLAERWLEGHGGPPPGGVRIDVVGVLLPARGAPLLEHVRGVT